MENNQQSRDPRLQSRDPRLKIENNQQSEDPLWIPAQLKTSVPDSDMAAEYLGPEPVNIEKEFQNEEETSNQEIPNPDKIEEELEEEKNCINPLDYLQLCWKSDNSENSDEDSESEMGYVSPINLSSDDMNSDEDDSDSDVSSSEDSSSDDDSEEDESDAEQRHRNRVLDLILQWMQHIYQVKLEEETIML